MEMDKGEILRDYCRAKNKSQQIGILAELNGCEPEKIREILRDQGIEVNKPGPKKKAETIGKKIHKACNPVPISKETLDELRKQEPKKEETKKEKAAVPKKEEKVEEMEKTLETVPAAVYQTIKSEIAKVDKEMTSLLEQYATLEESKTQLENWLEGKEIA